MLGAMEGLKDVGIYTMAAFMSTFIDTPRRMVVMSASPIIRMAMKENDLENMAKIQRKSISNLVLIAGFMLMMVMINLKDFYLLIPKGEIYGQGLSVVFFLGLAKMSEMLVGANYEVFMGSRYYYLNTFFVLMLAGLTILFNYIFIPIDGMTGAAYATLLSTSCVCLSRAGAFYYLFRINVYDIKILWMLIFFSLSGVVMFMAPMLVHPIISMGIKSLVGAVLMYIFLRVSKISPDLNTLINNVLEKIPVVGFLKL
jgi:O-antigen/teichoic acid export membrane protein